ncbi:ZYRO0F15378p [Zygosaccharomyces rouxii]|uniref:ZYRO0F15378p n=1 Tax=Zygosaccharomyces rouxii (strain ATCC 2623 / CBS 732 / NBRC 1130 / NCYC 568 / NRRL Y-229) TaxID=559307 RepID=C5DYS4_ZYGRC|nr:uncharacterized protein ZYRO0F15378g [Zygosaccharomyces rouxii]KAH9199691.1 septation initiation-domain-containing protein [Zygosaccharomyces rouxii]CAR28935.1 ZYRO0F15378p [Zygosaccharomyces rouxii]
MSYLEKRISSHSGLPTREEVEEEQKFDFTRGQNSEYNYSMFGAAGSPKQGNPWSFIDVINPKKHALAFAKELDNKRGIPIDNSKDNTDDSNGSGNTNNTITNTNEFTGDGSSQSTIRRLPSGAKPTSTGHTIQATTPVKSSANNANPNEQQNLSDVVGQSTPLTLEKNRRPATQNSDDAKDYDGLVKETHWLHEEIAQLKDQLLRSESQKVEKDAKIVELGESLQNKSSSLQNNLREKENSISTLQDEIKKLKEQWAIGNKRNESEMDKKLQLIQEMERRSQEAIQELKLSHQRDQDSLNEKLKKLDTNWHENLENEKQKLIADIDSLEAEYDNKTTEFQNTIKEKIQQLEVSDEALRKKTQELDSLRNDMCKKNDELANKLEELEEVRKNLKDKDSELAGKSKELQELQSKCEQRERNLQNDLKSKDERINVLSDLLKQRDQNISHKDERITELSDLLKQRDQDISHKDEENRQKVRELKALEAKFSEKNDEFSRKSKDFDLLQESRKEVLSAKSQVEQQLRKSEIQTKKVEDRFHRQRMDYNEQIKQLQQSLEDEKKRHDNLKDKMKEVDQFAQYIEDLELFEIKLGNLIVDTFKKSHETKNLDPFFIDTFKDVIGFRTKQQDKSFQDLQSKIDALELKNQELIIQIEHQWKSKVESEHQELEQHKYELEQLQKRFKNTEDKLATTQAKLEIYQEEKSVLLKEKESVLQSNVALNEEFANYKSNSLNKDQERFLELVGKIEEQTELIRKLQDDIKNSTETTGQLESQLEILHKEFDSKSSELDELHSSVYKLKGDPSRKITFEVARRSRPDINAITYENLMVNKVDSIDMVELQNIVKNLILLLDIPFNKLTKKSPLVAIYLKYERPIFSHFANRLHYQMFNEPIDMKRFANEAYGQYTEDHDMRAIKHPLQSCLDNLYQRLVSKI